MLYELRDRHNQLCLFQACSLRSAFLYIAIYLKLQYHAKVNVLKTYASSFTYAIVSAAVW